MECLEYIECFLSADADDELSPGERRAADQHLAGCSKCRMRLAEERALKESLRRHVGIIKAPADVRLRIRAALGEHTERGAAIRGGLVQRALTASRRDSHRRSGVRADLSDSEDRNARREWLKIQRQRLQYAAPAAFVALALAVSLMLFKGNFGSTAVLNAPSAQRAVPAFDFAIASYERFSRTFAPNVPAEAFSGDNGAYFAWVEESDPVHHVSDALPDISSSYEKMQMLPEFCDFARAGYQLVGGRVDHLDGEPVTYTLYRKQSSFILSIGLKQRIDEPGGGYWFENHAFYTYRNYTFCLTVFPNGHFVSIIVTRSPMEDLLREVAASDFTSSDG